MPTHKEFIPPIPPSIPPRQFFLTTLGAFFPIEIHIPPVFAQQFTNNGQPLPPCAKGVALIDTGATNICVHESILTGLGLNPVGAVNCGTANGPALHNVYPARIVFPTKGWIFDVAQVQGVNLTGQNIPTTPTPTPILALLGRKFLQNWVFIYNGPGGFWTVNN